MTEYFIKISHGFPEHWKTEELSDKAFRHLVTVWCLCARMRTDGKLTAAQARKYFTPKTLAELVAVGYMHQDGDSYWMHQYTEHQTPAAAIDDLHQKRVEAGRRGGQAKATRLANGLASAKQTGSKPLPEVEVEEELETTTTPLPPPSKQTAVRGTRLPGDWTPSPDLVAWVKSECPDIDGRAVTAEFCDYWHGVAGSKGVKLDWDATFRNKARREQQTVAERRRVQSGRTVVRAAFGQAGDRKALY